MATRPLHVLVVDDDEDHRFFIRRALKDVEGLELDVAVAHDGQEALDRLAQQGAHADAPRPDFILLDLRMPRMSGLEVLERIKSDPELREIPISVLSSSDSPEDVRTSYQLGSNAYIRKSMSFAELSQDLESAAHFWGLTAELPERRT